MTPVSKASMTVNLFDTELVDELVQQKMYQGSAYRIRLKVRNGNVFAPAGLATAITFEDSQGQSVTIDGGLTDDDGDALIEIGPHDVTVIGDCKGIVCVNGSKCGEFFVEVKSVGSAGPPPGTVVDWSLVASYQNTATDGPYRAGTNTTFTTNADGSVNINTPDAPAVPVQSVDGKTGDVDLSGDYLGINATAADVDPTGTAIAGALAGKAKLEGGNTFDASPQIMGILQALALTGLLVRDSEGNLILTIGNQTPGTRQLRVEGVIETSAGTLIGSDVNAFGTIIASGGNLSSPAGRMRAGTGDAFVVESLRNGGDLFLRARVGSQTTGNIILGDLGEACIMPILRANSSAGISIRDSADTEHALITSNGIALSQLTASLPLALDANKRAVTLPAADFRTLIGLVIGTDVQAQNATLQALADAADDAARRAVIKAAPLTPTVNAQTGTTYTLALADAGAVVTATNADAVTVTVPTNAAIAYPVGTVINVLQGGAGAVTVEGDTGVTVNGVSGGSVTTTPQYQGVSLLKVATDEWIVSGAADIPIASTTVFGLAKLPGISALTLDGNKSITPSINGEIHNVTLAGNHTLTLNDPTDTTKAVKVVVRTIQDATGGRTLTWAGNIANMGGVGIPAPTSTANAVDRFAWIWTGARWSLDAGTVFDERAL